MCLAEALLRIPDKDTADALIAEKIGEGRWERHLGASDSLFVNASTFGLMLTGRVVRLGSDKGSRPRQRAEAADRPLRRAASFARRCARPCASWPTTSCSAAPSRRLCIAPLRWRQRGYLFSYDMLGERAKTGGRRLGLFRALHVGHRGGRQGRPALFGSYAGAAGSAQRVHQAVGAQSALRSRQGGAARPRAARTPHRAGRCRAAAMASA